MQRTTPTVALLAAAALLSAAAPAARAAAKDDVKAAVQKLADAPSYAFATTTEGGQGGNGSGKVEKGGYTSLEMTLRDNTLKAVRKGDKAAIETDDGWKSPAEMQRAQGPQRYVANMVRNYRTPAENAQQYLSDAAEVKKGDNGTFTAEMPEAAAKKMLTPNRGGRRGGGGGNGGGNGGGGAGPQVSDAKASVTFTLTDGSLSKMQVHVSGTVSMGGNDRDVDRTTTTEFKDVGTAKADVPAEAKAKLEAAPATTQP